MYDRDPFLSTISHLTFYATLPFICACVLKYATNELDTVNEQYTAFAEDVAINTEDEAISVEENYSISDEEEYTVTPTSESVSEDLNPTAKSSSANWIIFIPMSAFLLVCAGGCVYAIVNKDNSKSESSSLSEYKQSDNSYSAWRGALRLYIQQLERERRNIAPHTHDTNKALQEIIQLCETIYKETDETEYMSGELSKINTYYLPTLLKLVSSLSQLYNLPDTIDIAIETHHTVRELQDTIIASKQVFVNMVRTSLEKDLIDVSADAAVFKAKTAQALSPMDMKIT